MTLKMKLRWTAHVTKMPEERLQKKVLHGELQVGRVPNGQNTRYKDIAESAFHRNPGNRLPRIEQTCITSLEREQLHAKQRCSVKLKEFDA